MVLLTEELKGLEPEKNLSALFVIIIIIITIIIIRPPRWSSG